MKARLALKDSYAPSGTGEKEVGMKPWHRHGVIARARGVIHREDDLGHGSCRHGCDEARTGANYALMLGLRADHESGDILHEEQRNPLPIAAIDEERHLLGALRVENTAESRLLTLTSLDESPLVRNDAHGHSIESHIPATHLSRELALELGGRATVDGEAQEC